MKQTLRFRNIPVFLWFLTGFLLFLTTGVIFSVTSQRALLLHEVNDHMQHELSLLKKVIQEDLLEHEYTALQQFITLFADERKEIVTIKVLASNGAVLAESKRSEPAHTPLVYKQRIAYKDDRYVTVEVVEDFEPVLRNINNITKQYIAYAALFAVFMGAGLWYTFRKTALVPLGMTVKEANFSKEVLEQRVQERTLELIKANSELEKEIQDRAAAERELKIKDSAIATSANSIVRAYDNQFAISSLLDISLATISFDEILDQALELVLSIPWLALESQGAIFFADNEKNELVMKVQKGLDHNIQKECARVPFGVCLCGRAAVSPNIQFSDRIDDRHDISYEGISSHGHYCVPIIFSGKILGVIALYLKEGHLRDEKEEEFLNTFANALAGIIQRRRAEEERNRLILELEDTFEKVSRARKEWQETFDSITDLIYITDVDRSIIRANRAFAAYFGMEPRDVISKKCHELFHGDEMRSSGCPHATSLREKRMVQGDFVDGQRGRIFLMTAFPYLSQDGEIIGSIVSSKDVTDEKEREMRLIMSERLASLGQMASGIAHEINNPLAAIAGCTEGLLRRVTQERYDAGLFANYLNIIEEEIRRCKNITSGMLSFVRKTTYDIKAVDVHELLEKTLEIIGFQGRLKEVEVIRSYKEGMPRIRGSEGELRQVFLAIITNALDAMEDRGKLKVETGSEGEGIFLRITDTGHGISPEHTKRIFDPFFTTKGEKGGTGLGLSIANKIITNHNGSISISSEAGKGTTFTIILPL